MTKNIHFKSILFAFISVAAWSYTDRDGTFSLYIYLLTIKVHYSKIIVGIFKIMAFIKEWCIM